MARRGGAVQGGTKTRELLDILYVLLLFLFFLFNLCWTTTTKKNYLGNMLIFILNLLLFWEPGASHCLYPERTKTQMPVAQESRAKILRSRYTAALRCGTAVKGSRNTTQQRLGATQWDVVTGVWWRNDENYITGVQQLLSAANSAWATRYSTTTLYYLRDIVNVITYIIL